MKTIILNGSPRKKWNTDLMLREAEKGAASVGARRSILIFLTLIIQGVEAVWRVSVRGQTGVNAIGRTICHRL